MLKWKLMATTLPLVLGVTAIKAVLEYGFKFGGVVEFGDVGVVLTGAVFLTGFLLAGTMSDYKESERLPGEVAVTLETIEEVFTLAAAQRPSLQLQDLQGEVLKLTDSIYEWLIKRITSPQVFAALTRMGGAIVQLEKSGAGPYASRAVPQLLMLRRSITRMDVITRTGFLPPAYALLEVLLVMVLVLMLLAKFRSPVAEFVLVAVVSLVNIYMLRLIRDIDNPFDYAPDGSRQGAAEVELFPITEFRARLAERIAAS